MFLNGEMSKLMRTHLGGIQLHFTKSNPVCNLFMINYLIQFNTNFCRMASTTATRVWDWTLYNMWQHLQTWIGFPTSNVPTSDAAINVQEKNAWKVPQYFKKQKSLSNDYILVQPVSPP